MIGGNCRLGKTELPLLPCSCSDCPWFVDDIDYNFCFWIVSSFMGAVEGWGGYSNEEIARMEHIQPEEVEEIVQAAVQTIRMRNRRELINM
jgi:hypothetical protein